MTSAALKRVFSLVLALFAFVHGGVEAKSVVACSELSTISEDVVLDSKSYCNGTHGELEHGDNLFSGDVGSLQSLSITIDYDDEFDDDVSSLTTEDVFFHFFTDSTASQYRSFQYDRVKLFLLYSSPKLPSGSL